MIYSAQLCGSAEICDLVKQRSSVVNLKAITAFLTYSASEKCFKRTLNDALHFYNDLSVLEQTFHFTYSTVQKSGGTRHFFILCFLSCHILKWS